MFSIIIPTFNNLKYLELCLKSLKKNSKFDHEIIVFINEGIDGTLEFVKENNLNYLHNKNNVGLCKAMNEGVKISSKKYIVYAHDDMYFCPNWDTEFYNEISKTKEKNFFLSGTMIQPFKSFINLDCGKTIEEFNELKLLKEYNSITFEDFQGSTWAPSLIPRKTWDAVGGFSEEYGPGLGSDPDFNMKLWKIGVRLFKGLSRSRVYHFSSVTLRKKISNNGAKTFLLKWGVSIKFFRKYYLKSDTPYEGLLKEPDKNFTYYFNLMKCKFTYLFHSILFKKNV